jgi:soluble lytic murein transglycosylase-like protein
MNKYINLGLVSALALLITGCSFKTQNEMFVETGEKYNINHKTLKAICKKESGLKPYVVNVNKSIFDIQRGGHYFDTWLGANAYMDLVLDPLGLNYDIGLCQINKIHLDRFDLDNEDLLDEETNIDIAARIYKWNVKECKGNLKCALSMYNTGKKNSSIGMRYANKVIKIRKQIYGN